MRGLQRRTLWTTCCRSFTYALGEPFDAFLGPKPEGEIGAERISSCGYFTVGVEGRCARCVQPNFIGHTYSSHTLTRSTRFVWTVCVPNTSTSSTGRCWQSVSIAETV